MLSNLFQEGFTRRKIKTDFYSVNDKDDVVVRQSYTDVFDESGFLIGIDMKLEWFDEMGNPALFKTVQNSLPISSTSEELELEEKDK